MTWPVAFDPDRISLHVSERISEADADRQARTAGEILRRLGQRPGIVLADEVGMGKTFVALAVAVSAVWRDRGKHPVVVMVPPSLRHKWPKDFDVFRTHCLRRDADRETLRARSARTGVDFFKLLDDPPSRRPHIVFLTHGALHRGLNDPWVKFAILVEALRSRRLKSQREAFPRFAAETLRMKSKGIHASLFIELMKKRHESWRDVITKHHEDPGDDPVPEAISKVILSGKVDLTSLREKLADLPLRWSKYLGERLQDVRTSLGWTLPGIWREALRAASFHSPLLILDEAHHLKNPATRLASLFVDVEAEDDANILQNALGGAFERMVFLTATPFQLGHHELLNVLDRFQGIRWRQRTLELTCEQFEEQLEELRRALDTAHVAATALDQRWGKLTAEDLLDPETGDPRGPEMWWKRVESTPDSGGHRVVEAVRAFRATREAMGDAERLLRPWVIRHRRPMLLPESDESRRRVLPGRGIRTEAEEDEGLPIADEALLPFLLAARCQAIVASPDANAAAKRHARATFAEGLSSSYEAYLETRAHHGAGGKHEPILDEDQHTDRGGDAVDITWYLEHLGKSLPDRESYGRHPKVSETVDRAVKLWESGEKVLVFCHFRATGAALTFHMSTALANRIWSRAAARYRGTEDEVLAHVRRLGERFQEGRPYHRQLSNLVDSLLVGWPRISNEDRSKIVRTVLRFVRAPTFLVRYFPLEQEPTEAALEEALQQADGSGLTLTKKLEGFIGFLAGRCIPDERIAYIDALGGIQSGMILRRKEEFRQELLPNVRLVNGGTADDVRRRVMLAFNTPFFPEILVASSVLAEGVDLHLDCRYIIHHDLSWNPSTLEQRTGRIDRIGAKAEVARRPIHVFLPFVAGTQDEKMYRVVRDRERWFQVLMDEHYTVDEHMTEALAERIPLPETAARELTFRLEAR